jgi:hypothetical protein
MSKLFRKLSDIVVIVGLECTVYGILFLSWILIICRCELINLNVCWWFEVLKTFFLRFRREAHTVLSRSVDSYIISHYCDTYTVNHLNLSMRNRPAS